MLPFIRSISLIYVLVLRVQVVGAFTTTASVSKNLSSSHQQKHKQSFTKSSSRLNGENSDGIGNVLNKIFGGGNNDDNNENGETVLDLSASSIKVGPLRFLLNMYLVGQQNNPAPNSWLTRQSDDSNIEVYYGDGSAMLSFNFQEPGKLRAFRQGQRPSLQYQLQESILLHGVLDELELAAFGDGSEEEGKIKDEQRLLKFSCADAIADARGQLPARQAT